MAKFNDKVLCTISEELASNVKNQDLNNRENDVDTASTISMDYDIVPTFEETRSKLMPLLKTDAWYKSVKELLQKSSSTHSVFYKPLNKVSRIDYGFTVAILCDDDQYRYVLNKYLSEWHISGLTLVQIAEANFRKRLVQEGKKWQTSHTGVRFMEGPLAASVILLPDVIESLGGQQGDIMACIPATDLCMIGDTRNVKHICVISEIALKFLNKPRFLSTQPLRLVKKEWKIFEANRADDEHPFPKSADEVKILKRALRMQGKI